MAFIVSMLKTLDYHGLSSVLRPRNKHLCLYFAVLNLPYLAHHNWSENIRALMASHRAYPDRVTQLDTRLMFAHISIGPQVYAIVIWSCYVTKTGLSISSENYCLTFRSDPKWPQINIWCHIIGREFHASAHIWVLWSYSVSWMCYSIYSENDLSGPSDPKWP